MLIKRSLLTLGAIFMLVLAQAQINEGAVLLGGNISHSKIENINSMSTRTTDWVISPSVGIALRTNLVAGVGLNYSNRKYREPNARQDNDMIGGMLFLRKYIPLGRGFYFFAQGGAGYTHLEDVHTTSTTSTSRTTQKTNTIQAHFYPGLSFAINKRIHLEAGLNNLLTVGHSTVRTTRYTSWTGTTTRSKGSSLNFDTNVSGITPVSIGFRFLFNK